jgi:hypothetical protein
MKCEEISEAVPNVRLPRGDFDPSDGILT